MIKTFVLFIGSNNATGELETDKIIQTISEMYDGFTLESALGYWQGKPEHTAVVTLMDSHESLMGTIEILKGVLEQNAIAYRTTSSLRFA